MKIDAEYWALAAALILFALLLSMAAWVPVVP